MTFGRALLAGTPATIAGTVYGTIVVMTAVTAGASAFNDDLWHLTAIVVSTSLVFWIAHVYAHGLAESIERGRRLDVPELLSIGRRELSIVLAVVLPAIALVLGAVGLVADKTAVWLALGVGVATLAIQGVRYAGVEQLGRLGTAITVGLNVALGLAIIALKLVVGH